jgi:hypothetical protein
MQLWAARWCSRLFPTRQRFLCKVSVSAFMTSTKPSRANGLARYLCGTDASRTLAVIVTGDLTFTFNSSLLFSWWLHEAVSISFRTKSITKYTLTTINTRWEATQRVMTAKLTRLTHKTAIQLHLVAESCTICSSLSRRPVRKLLDTPSYMPKNCHKVTPRLLGRLIQTQSLWKREISPRTLNTMRNLQI